MSLNRLVNVGLRALTLLSKFSLIFFLALFLEARDVALYGLFTATVSYSIYCIGFNFYSFSTRELLSHESSKWVSFLRDQGVFFFSSYLVVVPFFSIVFLTGLLPWELAMWFCLLVVSEHLSQELSRLYVAVSKQLIASFILFFRSGFWALAVSLIMWSQPQFRSLESILFAWVCGSVFACFLGLSYFRLFDWRYLKAAVDWGWIRRGIKVALPLLIANLAIRGIFTIDRYWVQAVSDEEILAVYVFFSAVAVSVVSFLEAGVFVYLYPRIIASFKEARMHDFYSSVRSLLLQTFTVASFLCVTLVLASNLFLSYLNDMYSENLDVLYVLLVSIFVYSLSMVPHYALYAMSRDKEIIFSNVAGVVAFSLFAYFFSFLSNSLRVPVALCAAFSVVLIIKFLLYYKNQKDY
ncbi:hypothetical protein EBB56_11725 [Halomonas sp. YLB-10]|uniref:hypothetical protein n=1 Tax=Halomonas sp. YLB-10 TaxID=2483111 RepID=UPI000F5FE5B9|nr:hypothetical protein [Halomonas sp. YLB-10]RQW70839.1 hypothetical protein EBB56_11725 [Halomonas sp. YLB-10]